MLSKLINLFHVTELQAKLKLTFSSMLETEGPPSSPFLKAALHSGNESSIKEDQGECLVHACEQGGRKQEKDYEQTERCTFPSAAST